MSKKILYVDMDSVLVDFAGGIDALDEETKAEFKERLDEVRKYLGEVAHKRLILSHHKELNRGHFLIDDRYNNGAVEFEGEWIQFATEEFPGWAAVERYLAHKD
jgi:5'-nucleotidase